MSKKLQRTQRKILFFHPSFDFFVLLLCISKRILYNKLYKKTKTKRNDPSAGSPTDALLRLLFPLDHTVRLSFHRSDLNK